MGLWDIRAPDYVPPTVDTPAWVWSIVGWGYSSISQCNEIVIRLDYVKLDASGNFVRVNNFRPGWSGGAPTRYIPMFMRLFEGEAGSGGGAFVAGYDYWAKQGANAIWKNYIYKFLYGMRSVGNMVSYFPLP